MPQPILRKITKWFFVVANIIVAACFLLACYVKYFNPVQYWFFGLLTLASFYFLITLFLFFLFWLFFKSGWSILFIIVLVFTWKPIQNIVPLHFNSSFNYIKPDSTLRIMSWNVAQFNILEDKKHPEVKTAMLKLINQYKPDIACFQEVVAGDSMLDLQVPYVHRYYKKFRYYPIKSLVNALHFQNYAYAYNWKENFLYKQHFGVLILSKYPIINRHVIMTYPFDYNSTFQYADVIKGTDTMRVFNIHLQSLKFTPTNLHYIDSPSLSSRNDIEKSENLIGKLKTGFLKRQAQAEIVRMEINKSPYPIILCGDFNDVPNSYAYETIGNGLQNAFVKKGHGLGRTFSGIAPTLRIDNIFIDAQFSIEQFTRINKKLSDHFPIITDIRFK
ncbi:MAG: endonuclease/exonuclease/phosphatase family protein [Sphingobacteriales bacterium]|nr:endonuclease/exonuclease/phosphatase family protein [Sphingobacteriales bacterium]